MLKVGEKAPDFCLPDDQGKPVCLKDFLGKWVILYFYPKDNTPGCTTEAKEFSELVHEFEKLNAVIMGISKDSVESHKKFRERHQLKVILLSDVERKVIEAYGAWQLKKRFGKESYGVVRCTYIIDPHGKVAHIWKSVRAKGHAAKVLEKLKELTG